MNFENKTIFFLGDSITQGAGASAPENVYHQVAARLLSANTVINGIGGTRYAKQKVTCGSPDYDNEFPKRFAETEENYDFAVVFGGVNDVGHGDAPFGKIGDTTTDTFIGAVDTVCRMLTDRYTNERCAIILPMHCYFESWPNGEGKQTAKEGRMLREHALAIKERADFYGIKTLDLWDNELLNPNKEGGEKYFGDGLHPTDLGHRILGECVAEFLKKF